MKFKKKARFNKLESPEPLAWKKYHWILLNIYSLQTPVRTYVLKLWYMLKISVDTSCRHTFNRKRSLLWKTDEVFSADYKLMVYIKIPLVKPRDAKACSCSLYQGYFFHFPELISLSVTTKRAQSSVAVAPFGWRCRAAEGKRAPGWIIRCPSVPDRHIAVTHTGTHTPEGWLPTHLPHAAYRRLMQTKCNTHQSPHSRHTFPPHLQWVILFLARL